MSGLVSTSAAMKSSQLVRVLVSYEVEVRQGNTAFRVNDYLFSQLFSHCTALSSTAFLLKLLFRAAIIAGICGATNHKRTAFSCHGSVQVK